MDTRIEKISYVKYSFVAQFYQILCPKCQLMLKHMNVCAVHVRCVTTKRDGVQQYCSFTP